MMASSSSDAALRALEQQILDDIPITQYLDFRAVSYDEHGLTLQAPLAPNVNHKGTVFGGSLNMLTMLAGWGLVHLLLRERDRAAEVVVQKSQTTFLRPVHHDFRVVCRRPDATAVDRFLRLFDRRGLARLTVEAFIQDENEQALTFTGTYVALTP